MSYHHQIQVLIVESEAVVRKQLQAHLEFQGYMTKAVATKQEAINQLNCDYPQIVLLDIALPNSSDFQLATQIGKRLDCGLIITSNLGDRHHRLEGLKSGADDYLNKPIDIDELLLKIAKLKTRLCQTESKVQLSTKQFQFDCWTLDPATTELQQEQGKSVLLTAKERELLLLFVRSPQRLFSREQLIELLESSGADINDRAIDSRIARLRKKIEANPKSPQILQSVYGGGYLLKADVQVLDCSN